MGGRFLLDTHVPVDVSSPAGWQGLPLKVRRILENPDADLLLSVVSQVEVALNNRLGKLDLEKKNWRSSAPTPQLAFIRYVSTTPTGYLNCLRITKTRSTA
jgi:PIN domain nuclease of toxin-antitoxin system